MSTTPRRAQYDRYAGLLPAEHSVEVPAVCTADLQNDHFASRRASHGKRASRPLAHFLIMFYIGVAATLAWQSYSGAARQVIANLSPQLGWLAPQTAAAHPVPDRIEQIARSVDQIVTAGQEQITRSVDQLAVGQEQMTREILRLEAISQFGLYRNVEPVPRPTHASARSSTPRTIAH